MNFLLEEFSTPFQSIPFSKITPEDLKIAMLEAIELSRKNIDEIIENKETPNFQNTIEASEIAFQPLNKISPILFNLNSAETHPEIQQITQELSPILSELSSYVNLNETLFKKVELVFKTVDRTTLTEEQIYYLEKKYRGFLRSGVNLSESLKERLKEIDKELSKIGLQYGENVLHATNDYYLHITDEEKLFGLPKNALNSAKEEAKERGLEGWVFTLQSPSLLAVLKYANNRKLREEIAFANASKNFKSNDFNNTFLIQKTVELRKERAEILGYPSYSDFVLEERMAKSTQNVNTFLNDLLNKAKPFAKKEIAELQRWAKQDGIDEIMGYDHSYYAEKWKEKLFQFSEEETKPYFEINAVKNMAMHLAQKLFQFQFTLREDIDVYHPDVQVYEVTENNNFKALLYTDFHPRKGKRPGAWMTSYREQGIYNGENIRPHISIVCNFTKPTQDEPSLLTFSEVTTLFHELGHALHGICANTHYRSLSGTSVLWDFVELPSQFLENYCYEKEFLQQYAQHYKTGEPIPDALIDKIKASANFLEGYQTLRQLSFGMLDMAYHSADIKVTDSFNPEKFEDTVMAPTQLYPNMEGTCFSTSFSHIFSGGYASGYYSYKWAEVLEADAFAYFKENGIFNPEISARYKRMLSLGGTVDPEVLYEEFRGKKASNQALLDRAGLS